MTTSPSVYPDPSLTDGAIHVRPWTMRDLAAIESACHDPYIPTVTSVPSAYIEEEGRAFVERQWARNNGGQGLSLCIADARTDAALGYVGLNLEHRAHGRASFGYWVVPEARGRKAATAAVRLLGAWTFSSLNLARLEILVEPWNIASLRVAEQAGFRREGLLRSYEKFKGRRVDLIMHARTADDERVARTESARPRTDPANRPREGVARVRQAATGDWDAVWPLLQGMGKVVGPEDAARRRFEQIVQNHGHCVRAAVADNDVIGYAWAQEYGAHLRTGNRTARLHDLFVRPDHRGRGAGAALFNAVREWAREEGVRYLEWQASLSAVPFYERLGYVGDPCPQPEYPFFEIDVAPG